MSNLWHAPTRSLSLVDTILACLLLADTVVCCQSVSQLSHQPRPLHCTCSVAFCSWEQQAQICPHISYRKFKVWPKRVGRRINVDIAKLCNKIFFLNFVNRNTIVRKCPSDCVFIKSRKNHLIWQVVCSYYYSDLRSWRKMLWDYFKICLQAEN